MRSVGDSFCVTFFYVIMSASRALVGDQHRIESPTDHFEFLIHLHNETKIIYARLFDTVCRVGTTLWAKGMDKLEVYFCVNRRLKQFRKLRDSTHQLYDAEHTPLGMYLSIYFTRTHLFQSLLNFLETEANTSLLHLYLVASKYSSVDPNAELPRLR